MVKAAKKLPQLQAELGLFKQEGQRWSAVSHDWASAGFGSGDCGDGLGRNGPTTAQRLWGLLQPLEAHPEKVERGQSCHQR